MLLSSYCFIITEEIRKGGEQTYHQMVKGWTDLSPEVERSSLSGEVAEQLAKKAEAKANSLANLKQNSDLSDVASRGISRDTSEELAKKAGVGRTNMTYLIAVYRLIDRYTALTLCQTGEQRQILEDLPVTLSYEVTSMQVSRFIQRFELLTKCEERLRLLLRMVRINRYNLVQNLHEVGGLRRKCRQMLRICERNVSKH